MDASNAFILKQTWDEVQLERNFTS